MVRPVRTGLLAVLLPLLEGRVMAHTEREVLERLAERAAAPNRCPVCGDPITASRIRCATCPPRPLPESYQAARTRLRELLGASS